MPSQLLISIVIVDNRCLLPTTILATMTVDGTWY